MKHIILTIILLTLSTSVVAQCGQRWTSKNTFIELADHAGTYVDMRQTAKFDKYGMTEQSSRYILGTHPSKNRLRNSAIAYALVHTGVSFCLGSKKRKVWQGMTITTRLFFVASNYRLGVRIDL